jgi:hypothetical protein
VLKAECWLLSADCSFMKRTFTLAEANSLLPVLEPVLRTAMQSNQEMQKAQERLQQAGHHVFLSGGSLLRISDLLEVKKKREKAVERLRDALAEIDSLGVQVKDLEMGLLDFPCKAKADEAIVLLCWKLGEPTIAYWHSVDAGFKGRKPIDERITGAKPKPS